MSKNKSPKDMVILVAFNMRGAVVEEATLSYDDYYSGSPTLIDDEFYRVSHGIVKLKGEIYDDNGELQSSFENTYDKDGKYAHGRAVHADGTVTED